MKQVQTCLLTIKTPEAWKVSLREIPAPWTFFNYYSTKNLVKKHQLKQRLFTRPCTSLSLLSQRQHCTSSDAVFSPGQAPNTASAAAEARQVVQRERKHTQRACVPQCSSTRQRAAKHRSCPLNCVRSQAGRLLGTRREDTRLFTWLPQGSLQNPHGTTM